ncbi:unnamed protein product [Sphagnum jensenii]|uniref:AB hydrolase-1 domain-containing protein n=1 Tax=Sphagnum jensenii TaxID=128206 RepID=A0ABP1AZN7_9BRYO
MSLLRHELSVRLSAVNRPLGTGAGDAGDNSRVSASSRGTLTKKFVAAPRIPVNRLYPVNPQDDGGASFDIVFFHGLQIVGGTAAQEAYRTTWTNKDNVLWPKEWLPNDLENIRVFSLSYDAEATKWFGQGNTEDVEYIGENLFQSLVMGSAGVGCRPFVLVGHSFGGLVIKALINETKRRSDSAETNALDKKAIRKAKEFLQNLKGIVFYAVPHSGADAATLLSYFKFVRLSKIIGNLKPFSRRMAKMSVMMQDTFYNKGINIYAFGEGKPTYSNKMVVKAASAMQLAGHNFYLLEDCDHMQVCKPPSKEHQSYSQLLDVLRTCREGTDPPAI